MASSTLTQTQTDQGNHTSFVGLPAPPQLVRRQNIMTSLLMAPLPCCFLVICFFPATIR